jgi:hypothetical protein
MRTFAIIATTLLSLWAAMDRKPLSATALLACALFGAWAT